MLRVRKNVLHSALLHDMSVFHDDDAVGKLAHQVQIMGNQQHCHAVLLLQIRQKLQNLQSQAHIQRCITSSALSSASNSLGWQASAMAIMARWRWPPLSWCGYDLAQRSGSVIPVDAINFIASEAGNTPATWYLEVFLALKPLLFGRQP